MFAVIETGGKQYCVKENSIIRVEKLPVESGQPLNLDKVLLVNDGNNMKIGVPHVVGALVEATVLEQIRDEKILVFKKIRRHNYRRKKGHRQQLTILKVNKITLG